MNGFVPDNILRPGPGMKSRFIFVVFVLFFLVLSHQGFAAPVALKQDSPRLANYYLAWTLSDHEAMELAQWDLLILDMEVARHNPESIKRIREKNPKAVILAYITASELRTDLGNLGSAAPLRNLLASRIAQEWYLKNAHGDRRSFWPGTVILNVTETAPYSNGQQWSDVLVSFVKDEVMASGLWDGIFYDNAWENISFFANGSVDLDNDGVDEPMQKADELWRAGLKSLYKKTRAAMPEAYVFANDGPLYSSDVDGMILENFPKDPWRAMVKKLDKIRAESRRGIAILNALASPNNAPTDYTAMRYGLTTALSSDSFYSFDSATDPHVQRWWYDEYQAFLGTPRGRVQTLPSGLVRRDFDQGIVLVNPSGIIKHARFVEEFEKLIGLQDKSVNDGSIISSVSIPPTDGLVLLRRVSEVSGVPYENGAFTRVLNSTGLVSRAGFFAMNKQFADDVTTAVVDLDGDGQLERVSARKATLTIDDKQVQPFGAAFSGNLTFAFADTNGDGRKEIIVAATTGGNGEIRVYSSMGRLSALPFSAFGPKYKGGVSLAGADVNNDGKDDIIVGAGRGWAPEIRIFNAAGVLLQPGFFAFDPRFSGGVHVAAGALLPGKSVQILAGAGVGGGPQIRIFDTKGKFTGISFFAFDRARRTGVTPAIADVDGDGVNEILAFTRDFNVP